VTIGRMQRLILSRHYNEYHARVFPCWWKVLPAKDSVNYFVTKYLALLGTCLKALLWTPFGLGTLPTLIPLIAYWTSEGLVNFDSLSGAYSYARIASLTNSITAADYGSFTG
jgi:hypothetical protein